MTNSTQTALARVQQKLKAPKDKKNNFGGYKYRSCESILEAAKPLLAEEGLLLTITDDITLIGDRFYIKATATVTSTGENAEPLSVTAFAREELTKKGMDASQVKGASSSYARKYALNGLFLIDDTKDADTDEYHKQTHPLEIPAESRPTYFCEMCGKAVTKEFAEKSMTANDGHIFCSGTCRDKKNAEKENANA